MGRDSPPLFVEAPESGNRATEISTHPIHQMRSESVSAGGGNLGEVLGIVWLAWLLAPRRR